VSEATVKVHLKSMLRIGCIRRKRQPLKKDVDTNQSSILDQAAARRAREGGAGLPQLDARDFMARSCVAGDPPGFYAWRDDEPPQRQRPEWHASRRAD
jgi:hypothetical protein